MFIVLLNIALYVCILPFVYKRSFVSSIFKNVTLKFAMYILVILKRPVKTYVIEKGFVNLRLV